MRLLCVVIDGPNDTCKKDHVLTHFNGSVFPRKGARKKEAEWEQNEKIKNGRPGPKGRGGCCWIFHNGLLLTCILSNWKEKLTHESNLQKYMFLRIFATGFS